MAADLLQRMRARVLVADGAMGTLLHASGVPLDRALPELNLTRPDLVRAIHAAYLAAGVELLQTNTFGASRPRLARQGCAASVAAVVQAGVRLAHEAREAAGADALVAGSIGPVAPSSLRDRLAEGELRAVVREQVEALLAAGVDLLLFETFGDLRELVEAVRVAQELTPLPIVAQMTFLDDGRTLAGDEPAIVAATLEDLGVAVIGANCTLGPQGLLEILRQLGRHTSLPLAAQPNAGLPALVAGRFEYGADEAYFARYARRFVELGAGLVGGCCGTTPQHLAAVVRAVAELPPPARRLSAPRLAQQRGAGQAPGEAPGGGELPRLSGPSGEQPGPKQPGLAERLAAGEFVVAAELRPPAGADAERALRDATLLQAAGAEVVVIAAPASARVQVSPVALALLVQQRLGLEPVLTATTWDRSLSTLQADLLGAYAFGLRNVLCQTGTPPMHGDYPHVAGLWNVDALGLVRALNALNAGRDAHGLPIGRPTRFLIGVQVNPTAEDPAEELAQARAAIEAGVHFLVTPPVYDLGALERLLDALGPDAPPLLLGVMPLQDFAHAEYLQHEVPGITLPEAVLERMWQAGDRGSEAGLALALELIAAARPRVRGLLVSSANGTAAESVQLLRALPR
ncbi:MAG TPA: bifunctional homocysteine S-methyltransferase/methylenetetrahydrofolate reductase [Chloroflexota bacterium]|jgi:methionine synthase I (cobalamin-dependent)/5,10-methylenetetrahydrofolate reductase|nr:bifunctional homocysteine S-methyltransferase/methylenetetrahydrofolate reductase [Chloroflexota bacterium]